jgi:hypothetical protein
MDHWVLAQFDIPFILRCFSLLVRGSFHSRLTMKGKASKYGFQTGTLPTIDAQPAIAQTKMPPSRGGIQQSVGVA